MKLSVVLAAVVLALAGCGNDETTAEKGGSAKMSIKVTSPAFEEGQPIPQKYTDDGANISPPLVWGDVPTETRSIAIIAEDPDAPNNTWTHWLVYNISPGSGGLDEGVPDSAEMPDGTLQGVSDFGSVGYGGPAPPSGTHRYFFKVYALDKKLELGPGAKKDELLDAMKDHVLARGQLMGTYTRK